MIKPKYKIGDSVVVKCSNGSKDFHALEKIERAYLPADGKVWEYWINNHQLGWVKETDILHIVK